MPENPWKNTYYSYTYAEHEQRVGKLAAEMGFAHVSLSSEVMSMVKAVPRGFTTAADAYLTPVIARYVKSFRSGFDEVSRSCCCRCVHWDVAVPTAGRHCKFSAVEPFEALFFGHDQGLNFCLALSNLDSKTYVLAFVLAAWTLAWLANA